MNSKRNLSPVLLGLIIIIIGIVLLIGVFFKGLNADVIMAKYWPLLIFFVGAIMAAASPKAGLMTMLFGGLLLMYQMNLLGSGAGKGIIGFLIVILGLIALVTSTSKKKGSDRDLPPPR